MLIEKFFSLRKTENVSMDEHLTEVKEIANLLEEVDVIIPEDIIVYYTLKNLPKEYEIFKRMQIAGKKLPTYEQLEAKLLSEETSIMMETQQQEEGEALLLHRNIGRRSQGPVGRYDHSAPTAHNRQPHRRPFETGGSSTPRPQNSATHGGFAAPAQRRPNSTTSGGFTTSRFTTPRSQGAPTNFEQTQRGMSNQSKFRPRGNDRSRNSQCNFCGEDGHFERDCDLRSILDRIKDCEHRLHERRHRTHTGQMNNMEEPTDEFKQDAEDFLADQVVDACLVEMNMLEAPQHNSSWYLNSGATHHVSEDPSLFSSIHPISGSQIRSAGGQSHNVTGVGEIDIQVLSGEIKTVSSVLYTPGITKNLLSVGSLTDQQKTIVFKATGCFVIDDATSQIEILAHRENGKGLYRLQPNYLKQGPEVNTLHLRSQAVLWHKRLGHFHTRGIQRMITSDAVKGLPSIQIPRQTCTGCQLGKHARTKMPKEATFNASRILELIHSYVCGPFRVRSIGGARYFVTFTDDFSRKIWTYFISHKSQVLENFSISSELWKTLPGKPSALFAQIMGVNTLPRNSQLTAHRKGSDTSLLHPIHHKNGIAERRNRSLLDITRCLLIDKALPGHLWGDAVKAAGDILNLRTTKRHLDKIPNELFSGKKPSIAHLRIFGSTVFAHISKPSQAKLDPHSERCILLSFDDSKKAYRCYRPSTKQIFVSRDVFIDEDTLFDTTPFVQPSSSLQEVIMSTPTRREAPPTHPTHFDTSFSAPAS